jgi:hypothetical protein
VLFLQTQQVFNHRRPFVVPRKVQGGLLDLVNPVVLTSSVNQKFAHLQMSLSRSEKETGLGVVIEMVNIDPVFEQQLRYL